MLSFIKNMTVSTWIRRPRRYLKS